MKTRVSNILWMIVGFAEMTEKFCSDKKHDLHLFYI